jgi:hypothetical protein
MLLLATRFCPAADSLPFKPGEKLLYVVYWEDIAVGELTFETKSMATANSIPAYHFTMHSAISPFLAAILMISDCVESYADIGMTHALLYKEHNNNSSEQDATITFDWKKNEAQYSCNGKKYQPSALLPGAFDSLSVLYALRLLNLKDMREFSKPVSNGFACVAVRARVLGKQKVRVESGEYDAYVVEPLLAEFSKLFNTLSIAALKLWISADARRVPVKIICDLQLGSLKAELKSSKTGG